MVQVHADPLRNVMTKCIKCGRIKAVKPQGDKAFWCKHCNITFDTEDDGNVGRLRPEQNAMRNEEHKLRMQGRLPRKTR